MIRYFCDGCDQEVGENEFTTVKYSVIATDESRRHLCPSCMKKFDPRNWPRHQWEGLPSDLRP